MELLVLAILVLLILGAILFGTSMSLPWFLIAALLYFLGLIVPALGCLAAGAFAGPIVLTRAD